MQFLHLFPYTPRSFFRSLSWYHVLKSEDRTKTYFKTVLCAGWVKLWLRPRTFQVSCDCIFPSGLDFVDVLYSVTHRCALPSCRNLSNCSSASLFIRDPLKRVSWQTCLAFRLLTSFHRFAPRSQHQSNICCNTVPKTPSKEQDIASQRTKANSWPSTRTFPLWRTEDSR